MVENSQGNEFIALASDTNFDSQLAVITMDICNDGCSAQHEFGTMKSSWARIAVKNHNNAAIIHTRKSTWR